MSKIERISHIFETELKKERQERLVHVQSVKDQSHNRNLQISIQEDNINYLGPRQVESLLQFLINDSIERKLNIAERNNIVYDGLGEHRILGKKKKKKSNTSLYGN